jgi:hypothetical protein
MTFSGRNSIHLTRLTVWFLAALAIVGLYANPRPAVASSGAQELVLQPGVRLMAATSSGTIGVIAGEGIARTYHWQDCTLESSMMARSQRWYGALGIYDPAGVGPLGSLLGRLFGCHGISRTVVQEAQVHFGRLSSANHWIAQMTRQPFDSAWTNDGLFIQWGVSPSRQQLNVSVWQVCVAGELPTELRGAIHDSIELARIRGEDPLRHACAAVKEDALIDRPKERKQ